MLIDRFGRKITYLRISVTDRCNYRCVYCMPPEGIPRQNHADILSYEEILAVAAKAVGLGIRRIRLTGGEPLIRRELSKLIKGLAGLPGLEEISLTTNGFQLAEMAASLAQAGLKRVNISLDTLRADRFERITRGGNLASVFEGISAAERAGLAPIKLNAVVVRGVNDDELCDLARLTFSHAWDMRFIELMPVGNGMEWGSGFPAPEDRLVPVAEMQRILAPLGLIPQQELGGDGPARVFRIPGALGAVGFISPVSDHFCDSCNRLRLTADGRLRPCLLIDEEIPIREALRGGHDLEAYLRSAIDLKPKGHALEDLITPAMRRMIDIGG
jgi:cyclic pyranopterin phosphate synthase